MTAKELKRAVNALSIAYGAGTAPETLAERVSNAPPYVALAAASFMTDQDELRFRKALLLAAAEPAVAVPSAVAYTEKHLADWKKYERVRAAGRYNMFDLRARHATGLSEDRYAFVMDNYTELETIAERVEALKAEGVECDHVQHVLDQWGKEQAKK